MKSAPEQTDTDLKCWTLAEVKDMTRLSMGFLRIEIASGSLPVVKCGRRILIMDGDLRKYINDRRTVKDVE